MGNKTAVIHSNLSLYFTTETHMIVELNTKKHIKKKCGVLLILFLSLLCDSSFPTWRCFLWFLPQLPSPSIHSLGKLTSFHTSLQNDKHLYPTMLQKFPFGCLPRHFEFNILKIELTFLFPKTCFSLRSLYFRNQHHVPSGVKIKKLSFLSSPF